MKRPTVDEYFMAMAELVSERSTCLRRKVGAVLVKDKMVLSTGYNGAPKGLPHCEELGGCIRRGDIHPPYLDIFIDDFSDKYGVDDKGETVEKINFFPKKGNPVPSGYRHELCRAVHAEQNAVIQAAVSGVSIRSSTLYCTTYPCVVCTKILINSEVKRIVYDSEYKDPLSENMLKQSEIEIQRFKGKSKQKNISEYFSKNEK
ncbi:MAG: cytidine/deoxycytidylate deaminase family protein [Thermoplasmata archaeon]